MSNQQQLDLRQDKSYRRGLVLGLTMAEVMILLLFVLLMALAAALQNRDERIKAIDSGGASRLIQELQRAYPEAKNSEDYFKELVRAVEARREIERVGAKSGADNLVADAEVGRRIRDAATASGVKDPEQFVKEMVAASARGRKGQWPPFFSLSEAGGYFFDSGKATLRPEFERNLTAEVIPMLAKSVAEYDVDVIEVIGHTDEVPMSGSSNLDGALIQASIGRTPIGSLRSTDNAGLAMARAVAVVQRLRGDARLKGVAILPLSGAQMIIPVDRVADGTASGSDQRRRHRNPSQKIDPAGVAYDPPMTSDPLDQNLAALLQVVTRHVRIDKLGASDQARLTAAPDRFSDDANNHSSAPSTSSNRGWFARLFGR